MIRNAESVTLFRNMYVMANGASQDILKGGELSCATFVSSVLYLFRCIESPHATVASLVHDLIASDWHETTEPHAGDIIVWEPELQNGMVNAHVGFALGSSRAISNDWKARVPVRHHYTFGTTADGSPRRAITAIYTHTFLS